MRILLVGDDQLHDQVKTALAGESRGYELFTCINAEDALEILKKQAVNTVLLDPFLPGSDSKDLVRRIRNTCNQVRIIILLDWANRTGLGASFAAGVDDYIYLPLEEADFFFRLGALPPAGKDSTCTISEGKRGCSNRYRSIAGAIPDHVFCYNRDGLYMDVITKDEDKLYTLPSEMIGKNIREVLPQNVAEKLQSCITEALESGSLQTVEYSLPTKRGLLKLEARIAPSDYNEVIAIVRDVTVQKDIEAELKTTRDKLLEAQRIAHIGNWDWDLENNRVFWSDETYQTFGYSPGQIEPTLETFFDLVHPDDKDIVRRSIEAALQGGPFHIEHRFISAHGREGWLFELGEVKFNEHGQPVRFHGITQDITLRKQAEKEIRESEARLRRIAGSMRDIVSQTDLEGNFEYVSPSIKFILGYEVEQILGKCFYMFVHPEDLEKIKLAFQEIISNASPVNLEIRTRHSGGHYVWMEVLGSLLLDEYCSSGSIVFVSRDLNERKKREEEYLKASKLESVGILASGIAHDFNNILAVILSNIFLARLYIKDKNKLLEKFGEVEKAVKQAKNLSNQLLTFAKGGVPVKKAVYVDELLNEVASLVLCGSNIVYEIIIPGKRCLMEVDEGQISQVINNIMINAVQAMPGGGIIRIAVEKIFAGTGELELLPIMKSGDYIKIAISDQGSGICEEYLPKIFDLFFTTKPEGSGLGLAIAYSVVRKHNGYISVDSRLGQGTTFYIYLPAYNGEPPDRPEEKQDIIVGRGRILIMDDNEALAEIVSDLLAELGYRTATARDGEKAVELYRQGRESGQPFDLVLMDLTVPGRMGGEVTIKILKEYDPEVKAIVTSGYSEDPVMREYERHGFKGFIVKPYLVEDLAREINRAINLKR